MASLKSKLVFQVGLWKPEALSWHPVLTSWPLSRGDCDNPAVSLACFSASGFGNLGSASASGADCGYARMLSSSPFSAKASSAELLQSSSASSKAPVSCFLEETAAGCSRSGSVATSTSSGRNPGALHIAASPANPHFRFQSWALNPFAQSCPETQCRQRASVSTGLDACSRIACKSCIACL